MTISTSRTNEFDIGQVVLMGYRMAGLLNEHQDVSAPKLAAGKVLLETIIKHLQVYGITARAVVLETVAITSGINTYSLSSDAFDVVDSAVHIDASEDPDNPVSALMMSMIDRERRQTISNEAAEGVPTLFYVDRTTVPASIWIWPTPQDDGYVRLQIHRLAADSLDTTKTPDLERFWAQYLIWELAHQLAVSNSLDPVRIAHLASQAQAKLIACKAYASPRGAQQLPINHPTAWSR